MTLPKASMTSSPRLSLICRAAVLACALLACAVPSARADWSGFGGDPGHSGAQPVDAGTAPLTPAWTRADGGVRTSVLISGDRVIYGTSDGVVHFRRLSDGTPVGGADVGDDPDVFGTPSAMPGANGASVSPVESGGHVYAAHNEGSGIEIAEFDAADGRLLRQFPVQGSGGRTIESSLLAVNGDLFFVAGGRLFKVPPSGPATHTANVAANPGGEPGPAQPRRPRHAHAAHRDRDARRAPAHLPRVRPGRGPGDRPVGAARVRVDAPPRP